MDREGFRNRMKQYKKAREENPGLKYWEWKDIPKYDEGTDGVTLKEKEDAFWRGDTQKMAELVEREGKQLTYITPESNLDEVVVTANKPKQNQYSELDFAKDIIGFTPIGDAIDLYDAGKALYKGNYSEAAMLGAGLLLPNWLEKSGKLIKNRLRQAVYNNIVPASYGESYLKGGKRQEIKNAIKDFISFKHLSDNAKWEQYLTNDDLWKSFKMPAKFATDVRKESWKRYLQLPHESKYYIDNADGTVSYNLQNIPLRNQQNYVEAVTSENRNVTGDFIGGAGGNVSSYVKKTPGYDLINLEDWWDLNPIQDPNRAGILPKNILNFLTVPSKDGKKLEYKKWVPDWFKNIEVGKFVGGKPFLNKTTIKAKQITKDLGSYEHRLSDDELKNQYMSDMLDMYDFGDSEDYNDTMKWLENKFYNEYLPKVDNQKRIRTKKYSDEYLLNMYGPFKRQYAEGGQVEPDLLEVLERSKEKQWI